MLEQGNILLLPPRGRMSYKVTAPSSLFSLMAESLTEGGRAFFHAPSGASRHLSQGGRSGS